MQRDEMLGLLETCSRSFLYASAAKAASAWLDKRTQARTKKEIKTMKRTNALFLPGLLSLWLVGCATSSQVHRHAEMDRKVAMIHEVRPGVTTQTTLMEWFGHPTAATFDSDKGARLNWKFSVPAKAGLGAYTATLLARVGPDGKVTETASSWASR